MIRNQSGAILLLFATWLAACVPLPDNAPSLRQARLPQPGDSAAKVRQVFGEPNILDGGRYLLYDWKSDRQLFLTGTLLGLPGAGMYAKHRFRMRVVLDDSGRVRHADCSAYELDDTQLRAIGCLNGEPARTLTGPMERKRLADIPALREVDFWTGGGSFGAAGDMTLSPDGRYLAASDSANRTWIIDTDHWTVVGRHEARPPSFWTMQGVPPPRTAFSPDGRQVLIAHGTTTARLMLENGRFVAGPAVASGAFRVAGYSCCPERIVGLGEDGAIALGPDGAHRASSGQEGRISFGPRGAALSRAAPAGPLMLAALSTHAMVPDPRASFGVGHAMLDDRNPFVRATRGRFGFSGDGRWLARNSCQHLELWSTDVLAGLLTGARGTSAQPDRAMMIALPRRYEDVDECNGAIAFSPDGRLVAGASRFVIHLWDMDAEQHQLFIDVGALIPGATVSAVALDSRRLTAVLWGGSGGISVARWTIDRWTAAGR